MGMSLVLGTVLGKIQVLEKCWPVLALGRRTPKSGSWS